MSTVAERVAAGAAFLDEREPGWCKRIDPDRLDMSAECRCVLGQLTTDLEDPWWSDITAKFGIRSAASTFSDDVRLCDWELGFNASLARGRAEQDREYAELGAEWRRVIAERRTRVLAGAFA